MCMVTAGTNHTADAERNFADREFEKAGIVSVNGQTAGVSTGTSQAVEL